MAGPKDFLGLQLTKLNINDITQTVVSPNCGAISTFIGITRDNFEEKKVIKLEYEAYEPMAIKEMQSVCSKIRSQWDVEKIAIYHRLGEVPVTEASIVIAISSPHRQESLQAVQFAIDAVKTSVPIWKKEIYENDESLWKENKECTWSSNASQNKEVATIHKTIKTNQYDYNTEVDDVKIDIDNIGETVEVSSELPNEFDSICEFSDDTKSDDFVIDPDLIQIKADTAELNRRIETFISRKREQVNLVNIQEFCTYSGHIQDDTDDGTKVCARVNAILIRRKDSKNHVKVHRVYNQWSHQNTKPAIPIKFEKESSNFPSALEERLSTTEKILGINKPVPRDVYARLKNMEDRLQFLESISPEYKDLWAIDNDCDSMKSFDNNSDDMREFKDGISVRKRTYSTVELDSKLNELETRYGKKAK